MDYNTGEAQRGKFARVAVEINLLKPLVSHFMIDGRVQRVEYEDLSLIYFHCGKCGHTSEFCKEREHVQTMSVEDANRDQGNMSMSLEKRNGMEKEGKNELEANNGKLNLGPWMYMPKHGRRNFLRKVRMKGGFNTRN